MRAFMIAQSFRPKKFFSTNPGPIGMSGAAPGSK
jgi:hypothetical protein